MVPCHRHLQNEGPHDVRALPQAHVAVDVTVHLWVVTVLADSAQPASPGAEGELWLPAARQRGHQITGASEWGHR